MSKSWRLIEDDEALTEALHELSEVSTLAVDTEFMRRNTFYPQIALLQLCAGETAFLVDPLKVNDLDGIRDLLTRSNTVKLLHSCSEDLEVFRRWLGVLPQPLVDTQRAAALLGYGFGLGYRTLVNEVLGIELDKGETRSDWLRRPLSDSQCHYAAQDVLQLFALWPALAEKAATQGRIEWMLEEGREALSALQEREREIFRRIKGAGRLSQIQLSVLAQLSEWREDVAMRSDRPRGWVLEDKVCLAIAQAMPRSLEELRQLDVVPATVLQKRGDTLIERVHAGLNAPLELMPAPNSRPLDSEQRRAIKVLRSASREIAETLHVAPEILMSGADLESLLRYSQGEAVAIPQRWTGWREACVIEPLLTRLGTNLQQS
ncbi:MAG: ribonuclease D [Congregibacter sp.]